MRMNTPSIVSPPCSRGYSSRLFKEAAAMNSQVCEQFNSLLKKIAISAQYSDASGYFLLILSFMLTHNHKIIELYQQSSRQSWMRVPLKLLHEKNHSVVTSDSLD